MKLALLGVAAMAVAVAVGASAGTAGASGAFSCKIKRFNVHGHAAGVLCGPATAELTASGRTYRFKGGLCSISAGTPSTRVVYLQVGTAAQAPATPSSLPKLDNSGYPYFTITTLTTTIAEVAAFDHGIEITGIPGPTSYTRAGKYAGTFTSHGQVKFSGSWNCHGVSTTP
jgi:hypothetical protein